MKRAYMSDDSGLNIDPNGNFTVGLMVWFYEEEGGAFVGPTDLFLPVSVTFTPGMNEAQMNSAVVAAIKAVGLSSLGWTMAANSVIYRPFGRG